jgi:hypothetical protein
MAAIRGGGGRPADPAVGRRRPVAVMLAATLFVAVRLDCATGLSSRQKGAAAGAEAEPRAVAAAEELLETHLTLHTRRSSMAALPIRLLFLRSQGVAGEDKSVRHHSRAGWRQRAGLGSRKGPAAGAGEQGPEAARQSASKPRYHAFPNSWLDAVAGLLPAFPLLPVMWRLAALSLKPAGNALPEDCSTAVREGMGTKARSEDETHSIRPPSVWEDTSVRRRRKKRRRRTGMALDAVRAVSASLFQSMCASVAMRRET